MSEGLSPVEALVDLPTSVDAGASLESEVGGFEVVEVQPTFDFEELLGALNAQVETMQHHFGVKHRQLLRWAKKQGYSFDFLVQSSSRIAVTGGLMASLLVSTPQHIAGLPRPPTLAEQQQQQVQLQLDQAITARKKFQLTVAATAQKHHVEQVSVAQQVQLLAQQHGVMADDVLGDQVAPLLSQLTGVTVKSELDDYRLNRTMGRIGWEQHLKRYPGDQIGDHFANLAEKQAFMSSGFAPGLGAYGYFASSASAMTDIDVAREKYYVAVQTFSSPNWSGNVQQTYNWFKYRKVLVYSPTTGQAVVADVADAGPSLATGKNFGGSPEVMTAIRQQDGTGSPPVIMLFVSDPGNTVPLGPVAFHTQGVEGL
jgi:hypothetical protein